MIAKVCTLAFWSSVLVFCAFSQNQRYESAKELFNQPYEIAKKNTGQGKVEPKASKPGDIQTIPVAYRTGLRYSVIQEVVPGKELAVDPSKEFHSGDRIRFEFESNLDGYLYVVQKGSSGSWSVLFPNEKINYGINKVQKYKPYAVPEGKYFVFNAIPGNEELMIFLCKKQVKELPVQGKPALQTIEQKVINELNGSLKSRDLIFEKDEDANQSTVNTVHTASTYVVNKNENGDAVVATISLKHVR